MPIHDTAENDLDFMLERHFKRLSGFGEETILVSYHGNIDTVVSDNILKLAEKAIADSGARRNQLKKVLTVLIEIVQNISLHSADSASGGVDAFLMLSHDADSFNIYSGNPVFDDEAVALGSRLRALTALSEEEVKKLYIETLCNEDFSIKGGAGLGFLTVVKKSDEPLRFSFSDDKPGAKYFTLLARIAK
jgi:hypothetical protein